MKRPLSLAVALLVASLAASARQSSLGQWDRVWPPQAPALVDVVAQSALDYWVADATGGLRHTTTAGTFWTQVQLPTDSLRAVAVRGSNLWAAGTGIHRSVDAGQTWTTVQSQAGFEDVHFVDAQRGFACGTSGRVLRSVDGGVTWSAANPTSATLRAVHFIDGQRGWCVGDGGLALKSVDGGATWTALVTPPAAAFTDVFFSDAQRGWIAAGSKVLRTLDGGASWSSASLPAGSGSARLSVLGGNWLWTTDAGGEIAASIDAGASWSVQPSPAGLPLSDVAMGDLSNGLAVGVDGRILRTLDGGQQWSALNSGTPPATDLVFDVVHRGSLAWATTTDSQILRSVDGGSSWTAVGAGLPQTAYRAIDFFDDQHGFAVGERQGFYPTTAWTQDGGLTWNPRYWSGMYEFWDVDALSTTEAIACADNMLWRTTDGGLSWNGILTTPLSGFFGADFFAQDGWAVGYDLMRTSDRGQTWTYVLTPAQVLRDVSFCDSLHGWAVGDHGTLLRSIDGGHTWLAQSAAGTIHDLYSVEALSPSEAWIGGVGGFVARTFDAGATWTSAAPADLGGSDSYGMSFDSPDAGFLCGYYPNSGLWRRRDLDCDSILYCQAKTNSLGCLPTMQSTGSSSVALVSGFVVTAAQLRNNKVGLLFYSDGGRAALPFTGGVLCVAAPLRRVQGLATAGTPPPAQDCSGVLSVDMNAFRSGALGGNPAAFLSIPGTRVTCQFWARDPGFPAPNNTQLSAGLEFAICP